MMKLTNLLWLLLVYPSCCLAEPTRKEHTPEERLQYLQTELELEPDETKRISEILHKTAKACAPGETFKEEDCKALREQEPKRISDELDVKQKKKLKKLQAEDQRSKRRENRTLKSKHELDPQVEMLREQRRMEREARREARRREREQRRQEHQTHKRR